MTNTQISVANMMILLRTNISLTDPLIIALMPNWDVWYAPFLVNLTDIQNHWEFQGEDNTGNRQTTVHLREQLTVSSLVVSSILASYANSVGNLVLKAQMDFTDSEFHNFKDPEVVVKGQLIAEKAQANLTHMAPYGFTAADLADYNTTLSQYTAAVPLTREQLEARKNTTISLKQLLKEGKGLLKSLDGEVKTLRVSQPEFVKNYKLRRKLVMLPTNKKKAIGQVSDADGNPMSVHMLCPTLGIDRKLSDTGRFTIQKGVDGPHKSLFTRGGFSPVEHEIMIYGGSTTEVQITMKAV